MSAARHITQSHFWKRLGIAAFAFFLVKGLVWLAMAMLLIAGLENLG